MIKKNNSMFLALRKENLRLKQENLRLKERNNEYENSSQILRLKEIVFSVFLTAIVALLGYSFNYFFDTVSNANANIIDWIKFGFMVFSMCFLGTVLLIIFKRKRQ